VDNSRFDALQDEMRAMRELLEAEREHAKAADSRRSSQLAELLADVHREIEVLQTSQQSEAQRTESEVNAIQRRAALDAFARSLECSTTNQMH
ncbi:MAG TPA: hypothetical protein PLR35_12080, partial [Burkholderiaceae bacterium]|nr:hypothetical protein [Burkholderiaceae bacterium]